MNYQNIRQWVFFAHKIALLVPWKMILIVFLQFDFEISTASLALHLARLERQVQRSRWCYDIILKNSWHYIQDANKKWPSGYCAEMWFNGSEHKAWAGNFVVLLGKALDSYGAFLITVELAYSELSEKIDNILKGVGVGGDKPRWTSSGCRAPDCRAGGRGFKPQTGPTLRFLT